MPRRCGTPLWEMIARKPRVHSHKHILLCVIRAAFYGVVKGTSLSRVENEGEARLRVARVGVGAAKRGPAWGLRGGRCVGVLRRSFCRGAWQSIGEALTSSGRERSIPTERFIRTRAGESGRAFFFLSRVGPFFFRRTLLQFPGDGASVPIYFTSPRDK